MHTYIHMRNNRTHARRNVCTHVFTPRVHLPRYGGLSSTGSEFGKKFRASQNKEYIRYQSLRGPKIILKNPNIQTLLSSYIWSCCRKIWEIKLSTTPIKENIFWTHNSKCWYLGIQFCGRSTLRNNKIMEAPRRRNIWGNEFHHKRWLKYVLIWRSWGWARYKAKTVGN